MVVDCNWQNWSVVGAAMGRARVCRVAALGRTGVPAVLFRTVMGRSVVC